MDGNKEEAFRCVKLAKEAVSKGDKKRALKFIGIARRLNHNLDVADVVAACEKIDSEPSASLVGDGSSRRGASETASVKSDGNMNGEKSYTEEHVQLIRQVKRTNDYYAVLGLKKGCSAEEIRKAYKKLSLKVHPDKNNAPGSDEAFKKVCKAFKCLSDDSSRRQYDQVGLGDEFEYNQQHNVRRRRPARNDYYDDDFDPDEIFRAFFGQRDMFRSNRVYRTTRPAAQPRENRQDTGPNLVLLFQVVAFLVILLLAYLPFSEPQFSLQKNHTYQFPQKTEKYGIEFFVKSAAFNQDFPLGSSSRDDVEDTVIKDYTLMLRRYCHMELQRRQWSRNLPTPNCDKLRNLGMA